MYAKSICPYLGILSVPMVSSEMPNFYETLRRLIIDPEENYRARFRDYLELENKTGSNKAASYLRALDLLNTIIARVTYDFDEINDIWTVDCLERLENVYKESKIQASLGRDSSWNFSDVPPSYLRENFISAALASYINFHSYNALKSYH
jgi:hypothetical protein